MAITLEELNNLSEEKHAELEGTVKKMRTYLTAFRDMRFVQGYSFDGRLAAEWQKMMDSLELVLDKDPAKEGKAEALNNLNSFGAFLNLNVGPAEATLRDHLRNGRNGFDAELTNLGQTLGVNVSTELEPAFNYQRDNEIKPLIDEESLQVRLFGPEEHSATDARVFGAMSFMQTAFSRVVANEIDGKKDLGPEAEQTAKELLEWGVVGQVIASEKNYDETLSVTINGEEKKFKIDMSKKAAEERFRTQYKDFINKKISIGGTTATAGEWFVKHAPHQLGAEKSLEGLDGLLNPLKSQKYGIQRGADEKLRELLDPIRNGEELDAARLAEILAVRLAANAKRNDLEQLQQTEVLEEQVRYYKQELLKNPSFQTFFEKKGDKLDELAGKKRTHGGALEDQFRDYLLKQPAGKLQNDPILGRWMPSYEQRIEQLQKQADKAKDAGGVARAMAEITVLRGMAKADRGNKNSLQKQIAADSSSSLAAATRVLAGRESFRSAAVAVKGYAGKGHGGLMVEKLRDRLAADANAAGKQPDNITGHILNRTTYKGRFDALKVECSQMLDALNAGKKPDEAMKQQYREIYLELNGLNEIMTRDRKNPTEDVDWSKMEERIGPVRATEQFSKENTLLLNADDMKQGLRSVQAMQQIGKLSNGFPTRVEEAELQRQNELNLERMEPQRQNSIESEAGLL